MQKRLIIFFAAILLLAFWSFVFKAAKAQDAPRIEHGEGMPAGCAGNYWECVKQDDGCWYKYCVNPETGKTIQSDQDVRVIRCPVPKDT